jgi:hypothetical protein
MSPAIVGIIGLAAARLLRDAARRRADAWLLAAALSAATLFALTAVPKRSAGMLVGALATAAAVAILTIPALRGRLAVGSADGPFTARAGLTVLVVLALFAVPAQASVNLVRHNSYDSSPEGSGAQLSSYLRAHRGGAYYEAASTETLAIVSLIVRDAQPVLVLNDVKGPIVRLPELQRFVRSGAVRYIVIPHPCTSVRHCPATTRWSVQHSTRVGHGSLYRFLPSA